MYDFLAYSAACGALWCRRRLPCVSRGVFQCLRLAADTQTPFVRYQYQVPGMFFLGYRRVASYERKSPTVSPLQHTKHFAFRAMRIDCCCCRGRSQRKTRGATGVETSRSSSSSSCRSSQSYTSHIYVLTGACDMSAAQSPKGAHIANRASITDYMRPIIYRRYTTSE